MSRSVSIVPTKFTDLQDQGETYGYRITMSTVDDDTGHISTESIFVDNSELVPPQNTWIMLSDVLNLAAGTGLEEYIGGMLGQEEVWVGEDPIPSYRAYQLVTTGGNDADELRDLEQAARAADDVSDGAEHYRRAAEPGVRSPRSSGFYHRPVQRPRG